MNRLKELIFVTLQEVQLHVDIKGLQEWFAERFTPGKADDYYE